MLIGDDPQKTLSVQNALEAPIFSALVQPPDAGPKTTLKPKVSKPTTRKRKVQSAGNSAKKAKGGCEPLHGVIKCKGIKIGVAENEGDLEKEPNPSNINPFSLGESSSPKSESMAVVAGQQPQGQNEYNCVELLRFGATRDSESLV
ncbi:hypothetical protein Tsubulata_050653 [Turnera subulata]|uniref:Uncharacterized protein n=1 Tax=Turnera subulata TaxID=218843 RepID=A0A9Q0JFU2_9ROSI|nr:hypothetical protein Tsubulata_050653 [Turnera subulata]